MKKIFIVLAANFVFLSLLSCESHHEKKNNTREIDKAYADNSDIKEIKVYLHPNNSYKGERLLRADQYDIIKDLEFEVCGIRNEGFKFRLPIGPSSSVARRALMIETLELGGDALFDFDCTNTKLTLKSLKRKCAGSFVCTGQAIKIKK